MKRGRCGAEEVTIESQRRKARKTLIKQKSMMIFERALAGKYETHLLREWIAQQSQTVLDVDALQLSLSDPDLNLFLICTPTDGHHSSECTFIPDEKADVKWTVLKVIEKVVQDALVSAPKPWEITASTVRQENVLSRGHRMNFKTRIVECQFPNRNHQLLVTGKVWSRLLEAFGPSFLFWIFRHCLVFRHVETSSSFLQVAGPCMSLIKPKRPETTGTKQPQKKHPSEVLFSKKTVCYCSSRSPLSFSTTISPSGSTKTTTPIAGDAPEIVVLADLLDSSSTISAVRLMRKIFLHIDWENTESTKPVSKIPKRWKHMIPIFQELIGRAGSAKMVEKSVMDCTFFGASLLKKMREARVIIRSAKRKFQRAQKGKLSEKEKELIKTQLKTTYSSLIHLWVPEDQVWWIVRKMLKTLIPLSLFGSKHNQKIILDSVRTFCSLHLRESLSLHHVLSSFRLNDCLWAASDGTTKTIHQGGPKEHEKRLDLVRLLVEWIFKDVVFPFVSRCFYVTETSLYHQTSLKTCHFPQSLWSVIESLSMLQLVKLSGQFECMPKLTTKTKPIMHRIRLLPKAFKIRPIINLQRRLHNLNTNSSSTNTTGSNSTQSSFFSVNGSLKNMFSVLRHEKTRKPDAFGSSVMGLDEIFEKLKPFIHKMRNEKKKRSSPFFVSLDIERCFDTIQQDHLIDVVRQLLSSTEYRVQRYVISKLYNGSVTTQFEKTVPITPGYPSLLALSRSLVRSGKERNSVFSDLVLYPNVKREALVAQLEEHLKEHYVHYKGTVFRQKEGIPQGSILSTLLCNLYYGNVESTLIQPQLAEIPGQPKTALLRLTDDFLLITESEELARRFWSLFHDPSSPSFALLRDIGCSVNVSKTRTNLDQSSPSDPWFSWCGLLIHSESLEIRADYRRYFGIHIRETISGGWVRNPGTHLKRKLLMFMKPKCHPLLIDTLINSVDNVYCNLFQLFLVSAIRFVAQAWALRLDVTRNPLFIFRTIEWAITRILWYAKEKSDFLSSSSASVPSETPALLNWRGARWLALKAFERVLRKKQSKYGKVLVMIRSKSIEIEKKERKRLDKHTISTSFSVHFKTIIGDPSNSEILSRILF